MTLPTSSAFSGPAARNSTALRLPSITSAMPARSTGSLRVSSSACAKAFDEAAQPEPLEVHGIRPQSGSGFFDDIHRHTPCPEL